MRSIKEVFRVPDRVPLRNRRFFAIAMIGGIFGMLSHAAFLVFFLLVGVSPLSLYNIASILAWFIGFLTFYTKERYKLATSICCTEIIVHQILCVHLVGWAAGFQYYLLCAAVFSFLIPRKGLALSLMISAASVAVLACLAFLSATWTPRFVLSGAILRTAYAVNLFAVSAVICVWVYYFHVNVNKAEDAAAREYERAETLLHSILPRSVAEELSAKGSSRPIRVESATILFSDFVRFTRSTRGIDPVSVVGILNGYFTAFDLIARKYKVERLKTIGDGYMCAGGIPDRNTTHPIDVCMTALAMQRYVKESRSAQDGTSMDIRIGINTGSVTAGIVGKSKFSYDIWGESVNTASRHESSGIEGCINVSKGTFLLVKGFFDFHPRGEIEIKGGETLEMYELSGLKEKYGSLDQPNAQYLETYGKIASGELLLGYDI